MLKKPIPNKSAIITKKSKKKWALGPLYIPVVIDLTGWKSSHFHFYIAAFQASKLMRMIIVICGPHSKLYLYFFRHFPDVVWYIQPEEILFIHVWLKVF